MTKEYLTISSPLCFFRRKLLHPFRWSHDLYTNTSEIGSDKNHSHTRARRNFLFFIRKFELNEWDWKEGMRFLDLPCVYLWFTSYSWNVEVSIQVSCWDWNFIAVQRQMTWVQQSSCLVGLWSENLPLITHPFSSYKTLSCTFGLLNYRLSETSESICSAFKLTPFRK